jgi:hypothetical protein
VDEPVDTATVAAHLKTTQGLGSIDIPSAYHSNWLGERRVGGGEAATCGARARDELKTVTRLVAYSNLNLTILAAGIVLRL